ncbi:MAG: serine hydrolase [Caldilineaceae bacterium]|nr:serine hydrolase [Caldilineaceae bacterium]
MQQQENGIQADDPVSYEVGQWIDFALGESNNYAANLLVRQLGGGDIATGARRFTEFMRGLGFVNTYMQSGYDVEVQLAQIPTPGNQRTDWTTNPDTNLQSSPADMGRLLAAIYDCTQGTGLLLETYGDQFTPEECKTILFYMSHDEFQEMLWSGLPQPQNAWIVHKHGFAFESHSDVGLVWGPTGPYVISVFLYRSGWMDWGTSNNAMKDVSRIVWNFFEFKAAQSDEEPPEPLELTPPSGYVPLNNFVPAAEGN